MLTPKYSFLLISNQKRGYWHNHFKQAISSLGNLDFIQHVDELLIADCGIYDLIIIDVKDIDKAIELTLELRAKNRDLRIVIASGVPTWRRAREILLAGAADYLIKSLHRNRLQNQVLDVLNNPPPIFPMSGRENE
jgi:response regulator of citrate/malate metabolism